MVWRQAPPDGEFLKGIQSRTGVQHGEYSVESKVGKRKPAEWGPCGRAVDGDLAGDEVMVDFLLV